MADSLRYLDWLKKANIDLNGAKILFEYDGDNSIVAFHCQQAIEKLLKGFILKYSNELVEGHNLIHLCRKSVRINPVVNEVVKDCAYINQFYIETRYPGDIPLDMSKDDAGECIRLTENIFNIIQPLVS